MWCKMVTFSTSGSTYRVVLDTNVFVAAGFNPRSASARIIDEVRAGRLQMAWNDRTRREIEAVVRQIPPLSWEPFAGLFRQEAQVSAHLSLQEFTYVPDPDDRKFVALAKAAEAVLITADDHLLATRSEGDIQVLAPEEFWATYG
jgi:putative PIN family toxin of toxin-antitoxin system